MTRDVFAVVGDVADDGYSGQYYPQAKGQSRIAVQSVWVEIVKKG